MQTIAQLLVAAVTLKTGLVSNTVVLICPLNTKGLGKNLMKGDEKDPTKVSL